MKRHVEIGCGNNRRDIEGWENIGVDLIETECTDILCNLGFEEMPIEDNSVDLVQAFDVLEHIPKVVYEQAYGIKRFDELYSTTRTKAENQLLDFYKKEGKFTDEELKTLKFEDFEEVKVKQYQRLTPFIFIMNDVFRILKDGGRFVVECPFGDEAFNRDPTHTSRLSEDWFNYFKQNDNLYADQGLVTCNFKMHLNNFRQYLWTEKDIIHTELIATKNSVASVTSFPAKNKKMIDTTDSRGWPISIPESAATEEQKLRRPII